MMRLQIILSFLSLGLLIIKAEESPQKDLENYLRDLAENSKLNFTVVLTRAKYFDNGDVQEIDSIAFASHVDKNSESNDFKLSSLDKNEIKKLVKDGENEGIIVSLHQQIVFEDEKNSTDFDTEPIEKADTGASNTALHEEGFDMGLEEEISHVLALTDEVAIIQVLEYFKDEKIKRNTTTTVYPAKIELVDTYKMSAKMRQNAIEQLRKAYKVDVKDRSPIIAELFKSKFPKYSWQVLVNSTAEVVSKDTMINMKIEHDDYKIIGTKE